MLKVGDKVRYLGNDPDDVGDLTVGKIYEVVDITYGDPHIKDDVDDLWCISEDNDNTDCFELAEPAQPTPEIHDLIANLARRVSELESHEGRAETHFDFMADVQRTLERKIDELVEQNAQQAYEINELYKAVTRQ